MKQINETIKFLQEKIKEVAGNKSVAIVDEVKNGEIIVFYEGKYLYAVTSVDCTVGDVLVVDGTTKVLSKPTNTKLGRLDYGSYDNAVKASHVLNGQQAEYIKTTHITMSYLQKL